jgi:hypothetical protein
MKTAGQIKPRESHPDKSEEGVHGLTHTNLACSGRVQRGLQLDVE